MYTYIDSFFVYVYKVCVNIFDIIFVLHNTLSIMKFGVCDEDHDYPPETIEEVKPIEYDDLYKNKLRDCDFSLRKYNDIIKESDWIHLTNNILIENTPLGNVLMNYNASKDTFNYYSDRAIPYKYIDTVGRKYVLRFNCVPLYFDKDSSSAIKPMDIQVPKEKAPEQASVFAKLKSYKNKPIVSELKYMDQKINRYTYEGKLMNFAFLKKTKTNKISYAGYKKLQQNTQ